MQGVVLWDLSMSLLYVLDEVDQLAKQLVQCGNGTVRSEKSIRPSSGELVLVDQPSQPVPSTDMSYAGGHGLRRCPWRQGRASLRRRDALGKPLVRTMAVVMPGIAPKNALEMSCVDDEKMIQALGSDRPDEPLRVSVRVRRSEWGPQDLGTF